MPSMMRARISLTSSEESVRSVEPTVSRNETLLVFSGSGGPELTFNTLNGAIRLHSKSF